MHKSYKYNFVASKNENCRNIFFLRKQNGHVCSLILKTSQRLLIRIWDRLTHLKPHRREPVNWTSNHFLVIEV